MDGPRQKSEAVLLGLKGNPLMVSVGHGRQKREGAVGTGESKKVST